MATNKNTPSGARVNTQLPNLDRAGLRGLVRNLYVVSKAT
jgi:hypothetical protein